METLLARLEKYRQKHLMEKSALGIYLLNDAHLMNSIEDGRNLRLKTLAKIEAKLAKPPKRGRK